jgi:hypothetical protein
MGNTPIYNLGYLEPNQDLSNDLDLDELRFKAIESQTYSLYQIFKNGIIQDTDYPESWEIMTFSGSNRLTEISISSGRGHVAWKSAETTVSKTIALPVLPTGVTVVRIWVYAIENANTPVTKDVDFISSLVEIVDDINYIALGGVDISVSDNTITVFRDNRQSISLFASLTSLVTNHKHVGGTANPAPIDLSSHVAGTLTGDNISNLDISAVTKGKLDPARLPVIDHTSLSSIGTLTHNQIDSLLQQILSEDTTYTLSDLAIANRLQMIIALKKISGFEYVDSTQINTLVYVPGVFPNTSTQIGAGITANFSDKDLPAYLTSATINDTAPWSSGLGISSSVSDSVYVDTKTYSSQRDFEYARDYAATQNLGGFIENIKISGTTIDSTDGYFSLSTPLSFKATDQPVSNVFNTTLNWNYGFDFTTAQVGSRIKVDTRLYAYKLFDSPIAMDGVSNIGVGFTAGLGETSSKLGSIYMYLVLSSDSDPNYAGDTKVQFDPEQYYPSTGSSVIYITPGVKVFDDALTADSSNIGNKIYRNLSLNDMFSSQNRTSIKGYGFYWSSLNGWNPEKDILFSLVTPDDDQVNSSPYNYNELQTERKSTATNSSSSVFVWNESLYSKSGKFIIRFDSGNSSTDFNLIEWGLTKPTNTSYTIQARTDTNSDIFNDLLYVDETNELAKGNLPVSANSGRYLDLLFTLNADVSRVYSPILNTVKLTFSTVGTGSTKIWNTLYSDLTKQQTGWISDSYYSNNIGYGSTYVDIDIKEKNNIKILTTNTVGNWEFLRNNSLITAYTNDTEATLEDGVDNGSMTNYQSPVQIYNKSINNGFNTPKDYQELIDGGRVFCDTENDRIVKFNLDGNITKVIQGNIRLKLTNRDFVALGAYYNPDIRKIFVAFSQNINSYTSSLIFIEYDGETLRLDDTRIDQTNTGLFSPINGQSATLEITFLDTDEGLRLNTAISNSRNKNIRFDTGSVTNGGFSSNPVGVASTSSTTTVVNTSSTLSYLVSLNSTYTGTASTLTGLPYIPSTSTVSQDFNADSILPSTALLGPNDQSSIVKLSMIQGPIYFYNIYNPISVHYSNSKIIIAQASSESVIAFEDTAANTLSWAISSDVVEFVDNKLGSAYEISDGKILLGVPALSSTDTGKLVIYRISNGLKETNLSFSDYDIVRALPSENTDEYYILTDDVKSNGTNTRLRLINSTGTEISNWGSNNEIIHPKGLRILSNNEILVSE